MPTDTVRAELERLLEKCAVSASKPDVDAPLDRALREMYAKDSAKSECLAAMPTPVRALLACLPVIEWAESIGDGRGIWVTDDAWVANEPDQDDPHEWEEVLGPARYALAEIGKVKA